MKSIIILFLLMNCASFLHANERAIPFDTMDSTSNNGNYIIICEKTNKPDKEIANDDWYKLTLKDKSTGNMQFVENFFGHVIIKWAPDDSHFSVIYRIGSNILYSTIYKTDNVKENVNPYDIVKSKKLLKEYREIASSYEEIEKWLDNKSYIFVVSGIGINEEAEEFEQYFVITLDSTAKLLDDKESAKYKKVNK